MNLKWTSNFILGITILFSCTNNSSIKTEIEEVKSATIKVHDELMVEMGEIRKSKSNLQTISKDSSDMKRVSRAVIVINELEFADKSMWDWMHNFDVAYVSENDSLTLIYFTSKYDSIVLVDSLFNTSISNAKDISYGYAQ